MIYWNSAQGWMSSEIIIKLREKHKSKHFSRFPYSAQDYSIKTHYVCVYVL